MGFPKARARAASLEQWIIRTLAAFNVRGERREDPDANHGADHVGYPDHQPDDLADHGAHHHDPDPDSDDQPHDRGPGDGRHAGHGRDARHTSDAGHTRVAVAGRAACAQAAVPASASTGRA